MSGRSLSVHTDTSALHKYLCTLIQNGHKYLNDLKQSCFPIMFKKNSVKSLKNCEKVYVNQDRSVSVHACRH